MSEKQETTTLHYHIWELNSCLCECGRESHVRFVRTDRMFSARSTANRTADTLYEKGLFMVRKCNDNCQERYDYGG